MKTLQGLYLALILLICTMAGKGQQYVIHFYNEADGLASSVVYDAVQDSSGEMWFATRAGITRYDGNTWTTYTTSNGLKTSSYSKILVDEKGTLWALPYSGTLHVCTFRNNRWHCLFSSKEKSSKRLYSSFDATYRNDSLVLAVGTHSNGVLIHQEGAWHKIDTTLGLPGNQATGVRFHGKYLFVSTDRGLGVIDGLKVISDFVPNELLPSRELLGLNIEILGSDEDYRIWMTGRNWLGYFHNKTLRVVNRNFSAFTDNKYFYMVLYPDPFGDVYFGNPFELYFYDHMNQQVDVIGMINGLASVGATSVFCDREKNTWITWVRGVSKIPSRRFVSYTKDHGFLDNEVTAIASIRPGFLILGQYNGITMIKDGVIERVDLRKLDQTLINDQRILDICIDRKKNIWIAFSHNGLICLDTNLNMSRFTSKEGLAGNVTSVVEDSKGTVWVSSGRELYYLDGDKFRNKTHKDTLLADIRKLFIRGDDLILSNHYLGLIVLSNDSIIHIYSTDADCQNNVNYYFRDSQGQDWVGMWCGLYTINDSLRLVQHPEVNLNRPVFLILEDKENKLWFGTDNGLFRWDGNRLHHFTVRDGISGHEANRDAGYVDTAGNVYIGTNNGLTVYRPQFDYNPDDIEAPEVKLQYLIVGGDSLALDKPLSFKYSDNDLTFCFKAISLIDENELYYRCMLKGFETEWSEDFRTLNNQYRYTNLTPGDYQFCVKARNSLGNWGKTSVSPILVINNPFWRTGWFIIILAVILAMMAYLMFRVLVVARYNRRLEKTVDNRTYELKQSQQQLLESNQSKDRFFSIIAHDLKSPFNAILGLTDVLISEDENLSSPERNNILQSLKSSSTRTINLLDNLLTWARSQRKAIPFHPEIIQLSYLVEEMIRLYESVAESKRITIINLIDKTLQVFADKNMLQTVIRNLLSNALKFSYHEGRVIINANRNNNN